MKDRGGVLAASMGMVVFSVLALSGPGRIDIVDAQTRYDVARSWTEHGDDRIRDPRIWWNRFPGRDGQDYTTYRFPQSALGVAAILAADLTGPITEDRRHFFFSLTGAAAAAVLAGLYAWWFLCRGLLAPSALLWAAGGIAATPAWFYATSSFDDILGATAVTGAVAFAFRNYAYDRISAGAVPGLLLGLAFNCKQPLAAFLLPAAAAMDRADWQPGRRWARTAVLVAGLLAGVAVEVAYDQYKFPPGSTGSHAALLLQYIPPWPGHLVQGLLALAVSPSAGLVWYCPAVLVAFRGAWQVPNRIRLPLFMAIAVFTVFVASMSIFKGDPAWGPRYFVPVYAVLWLWAPEGARALGRPLTRALIAMSIVVQVLSLTVDPHRLYVERRLPSAFGAVAPILYFDPPNAHLLQRPREIVEVWKARHNPGSQFTPAEGLTFAFPILDRMAVRGPEGVRGYIVLNAFRPWWVTFSYLPEASRPIPLSAAIMWLLGIFAAGLLLLRIGLRGTSERISDRPII